MKRLKVGFIFLVFICSLPAHAHSMNMTLNTLPFKNNSIKQKQYLYTLRKMLHLFYSMKKKIYFDQNLNTGKQKKENLFTTAKEILKYKEKIEFFSEKIFNGCSTKNTCFLNFLPEKNTLSDNKAMILQEIKSSGHQKTTVIAYDIIRSIEKSNALTQSFRKALAQGSQETEKNKTERIKTSQLLLHQQGFQDIEKIIALTEMIMKEKQ